MRQPRTQGRDLIGPQSNRRSGESEVLVLQVNNLNKAYGDTVLLQDANLILNDGDRVGLVGPNGCGKTTLLRILIGKVKPDGGSVTFQPPDLRVGYLEQALSYREGATISDVLGSATDDAEREVAALAGHIARAEGAELDELMAAYARALDRLEAAARQHTVGEVESVLAGLGLADLDGSTPVAILSGGQKTRLSLARLLLDRPRLLLLDEPTNHLNIPSRERFEQGVRHYQGTILAVVHDRYFIRRFASRIWAIHDGTIRVYVDLKDMQRGTAASYD